MELKEILAISGQPGLFKFVAQSTGGVIVESLLDGKRMKASATARVSSLGEIAVFTESEDLPLEKVFARFYDKFETKPVISHKSTNDQLKALFEECVPEYDRDNVKVSDMKKIVSWYNLLAEKSLYTPAKDEEATAETADAPKAE